MRARKETPAGTTNFIWDGQDVLLEMDAALATTARYTGFPGAWGGLKSMRRDGVSSFYGMDLQDTVRALISAAETVTDGYVLTAFGEEVWSDGTTVNPFRFEGVYQYYRDVAERLYVRARYLTPSQGQWLSTDKLRQGSNWYRYCVNRAVTIADPSGWLIEFHGCDTEGSLGDDIRAWFKTACDLFSQLRLDGILDKVNQCIAQNAQCKPLGLGNQEDELWWTGFSVMCLQDVCADHSGQYRHGMATTRVFCCGPNCPDSDPFGLWRSACSRCSPGICGHGGRRGSLRRIVDPNDPRKDIVEDERRCEIAICSAHGLAGCGFNQFEQGIANPELGLVLHEIMHCCGLKDYLMVDGKEERHYPNCADVSACCIASVLRGTPSRQRCRTAVP